MAPNQTLDYVDGGSPSGADPENDQIILYDTAMLNWLMADFDNIPGKPVQFLMGIPHHNYYAEVTTGQNVNQERLKIPRITLTRGDYELDPTRFNPNTIRRLGRVTSPGGALHKLRQAKFPVPISIPYQIDFWCEFVREMNIWMHKMHFQYAMSYKFLEIDVDGSTVWGTKKFCIHREGGASNTTELNPGDRKREIRRIMNFRADAWLYDTSYVETGVVKRIDIEVRNAEDDTVIESFSPNRKETLYTGDAATTVFSGSITKFKPILPDSFVLSASFSGTEAVAQDDGAGTLFGTNVSSGTIDYTTGAVDITYTTPPDAGDIEASWLTDLS